MALPGVRVGRVDGEEEGRHHGRKVEVDSATADAVVAFDDGPRPLVDVNVLVWRRVTEMGDARHCREFEASAKVAIHHLEAELHARDAVESPLRYQAAYIADADPLVQRRTVPDPGHEKILGVQNSHAGFGGAHAVEVDQVEVSLGPIRLEVTIGLAERRMAQRLLGRGHPSPLAASS